MSVGVLGLVSACSGCERDALPDENARINYSVGYQVGGDFRRQGVEIDPEVVVQAIADAMGDEEPRLTKLQMRKALADLQRRIQSQKAQRERSDGGGSDSDEQTKE